MKHHETTSGIDNIDAERNRRAYAELAGYLAWFALVILLVFIKMIL